MSERTLVLIKPDGARRALIGEVISRIERKGLVEFTTSGPPAALVAEEPRTIEAVRALAGAADPVKAAPGTIRADCGVHAQNNVVHGFGSPKTAGVAGPAEREIKIFFPELV